MKKTKKLLIGFDEKTKEPILIEVNPNRTKMLIKTRK